MIKISIIMPCFNAEAYILRGVTSAFGQTFKELELIVINDGSTDQSLQVLNNVKDSRLKIISQPNRGVSAARNRGIEEARGEYIAFLDTDDTWHPTCLEKLYEALVSSSQAGLSYCGWQNLGLSGGQGKPYIPPDYEASDKLGRLLRSCPWPIHAALTYRQVIMEAGGFDERFSNSEDYRLWLYIASHHRIVRVSRVLAYYHFHEGMQASRNKAKAGRDNWLVKKEFLQKNPNVVKKLGRKRARQLTCGMLLRKAYDCYWARDLIGARRIFRLVMKTGYGDLKDWKYMLPSLLPISLHRNLIRVLGTNGDSN